MRIHAPLALLALAALVACNNPASSDRSDRSVARSCGPDVDGPATEVSVRERAIERRDAPPRQAPGAVLPPAPELSGIVPNNANITCGDEGEIGRAVSCDRHRASPLVDGDAQTWFVYDDQGCHGGASLSYVQLLHCGSDMLGCTVRWFGERSRDYRFGFTGVATEVHGVDLSEFQTLVMEVRGDGRGYRAQLPRAEQLRAAEEDNDCGSDHYDAYGQDFVCGDGTGAWSTVEVNLDRLRQEGWGRTWEKDLSDTELFQIQTDFNDVGDFVCDFKLVELR